MNRIGVCGVAFKKKSIEEIAALASEAGADGVEIWGQPPHLDVVANRAQCERVRAIMDGHSLKIPALGSYYKPGSRYAIDGVVVAPQDQLEIAVLLDAPLIRIWAGERNYEHASPAERSAVIDEISSFADMAARHGIGVVIERHGDSLTNSWDSPASVLQAPAPENLFLNYQAPHPVPPDELAKRTVDDYRRFLKVSAHAHIQNHRIDPGSGELKRCYLDQGIIDYSQLGSATREANYDGWFMVEFLPADLEDLAEPAALKRDIDYLRSGLE